MMDIYNQFSDFKSFEAVFYDKEKQLQKIFCGVKSIEHNRIVISANNQTNKNIFASSGDELQLHIYTDNGIYSASAKVILVTKGVINTEYIISYPTNSKHSQRREYFRADLPIKFKLTAFTDDSMQNFSVIEGTTKNICGKGMSYIASSQFPEYSSIELELFFEDEPIKTSAQLVYSKLVKIDDRARFIHAFTFTTISKLNIEFIVKKCFLFQLNLKKKPL